MGNFGKLKNKILSTLIESYSDNNKVEIKNIIKKMSSNREFVDMHLFYEGFEKLKIDGYDKSKLYIESIEPLLKEKMKNLKQFCEELNSELPKKEYESNKIYECLDVISEEDSILNIHDKIESRNYLINYLQEEKISEPEFDGQIVEVENQNLLNTVLVNNFNVKFSDFLDENEKEVFKYVVSLNQEKLEEEMYKLKEEVSTKLNKMINESNDDTLKNKVNETMGTINKLNLNRYDFFKLIDLNKSIS